MLLNRFKPLSLLLVATGVFALAGCTTGQSNNSDTLDAVLERELHLAVDLIDAQVHADLRDGQLHSLAMARDDFVKVWIASGEADIDAMSQYLTQKIALAEAFTAFLVVDESLNYYTMDGLLKKVSESDPVDDWYFSVKADEPGIEFNIDPDEASEGQLTIFFNERVLDKDESFIATIGLGIRLSTLSEIVDSHRARYPHNLYFMTAEGDVLYYGNDGRPLAGEAIAERLGVSESATDNDQILRYQDAGHEYLLRSRTIGEIDMVLVVEQRL